MVHLLLAVIYISFISLGLPDSLLGSAWPSMYGDLHVPVSYSGILFLIIAVGTVISSLQSDRLTRKMGAGMVTAVSVSMTAVALLGFSVSRSFWALCLWAVPYGLGAGSVDAALNNYVALHYASRHMSWLHCMWGVGASLGPYVMGAALARGSGWNAGYRYIAFLQIGLTILLAASLPLWKTRKKEPAGAEEETVRAEGSRAEKAPGLLQILKIPGAKDAMWAFFCYCSLEQTAALWASSYLVLCKGISAKTAAAFASLFFIGITFGRALSGFLTIKRSDAQMIRLGQGTAAAGVAALLLPAGNYAALAGLILIGLGCAPIYPCIIHSTPDHFGADRSQAMIGVQMASAYVGSCLMPPLFGLVVAHLSASFFPVYLAAILVLLVVMHELLQKHSRKGSEGMKS